MSSESGLHFRHHIAGTRSDYAMHIHALKATLELKIKRGIVLNQWAQGLSVMIEKIAGCALIMKVRSQLLMEAGFNTTNKMIHGN